MTAAGVLPETRSQPANPPWTAVGPVDAPAIVFIHATRLTRNQWLPQLRLLSGRYRCVALDLPGHGVRAGEPFALDAAAAAVAAAISEETASGRAIVVGLSLGGYVAIDAAERYPSLVAGLVLAGCSAEALGPVAIPFRTLARILERAPARWIDLLNIAFFRIRFKRSVAEPIIAGGFWPVGGAQAVRKLVGRRYQERLGRLWTPVLILNGALDPVFGPRGEAWAAGCRRGRQEVLPLATHLSNLDRPRSFAAAVARFAREVATGG